MTDIITKSIIVDTLKQIGVKEGMELEVHSSLSSFGHVEGGAETVISALKECCGETGSIFMPALRFSKEFELTESDRELGLTTKIKILEENCERSAMGIIADTFRKQSDTVTGGGIFRICGWGKYADEAVKSGLRHVINNGGMGLLLGVDIYKLTAMHYVEDSLPQKIREISAPNQKARLIYPDDKWLIEGGETPVKPWYTIYDMAVENGYIQVFQIGKCKAMFFKLKDVVRLYRNELINNPYKLYGLE